MGSPGDPTRAPHICELLVRVCIWGAPIRIWFRVMSCIWVDDVCSSSGCGLPEPQIRVRFGLCVGLGWETCVVLCACVNVPAVGVSSVGGESVLCVLFKGHFSVFQLGCLSGARRPARFLGALPKFSARYTPHTGS